jgi:hypothetical protein
MDPSVPAAEVLSGVSAGTSPSISIQYISLMFCVLLGTSLYHDNLVFHIISSFQQK